MPLQKFDWFWRSSELTQVIAHLLKWNDERDFETGSGTQKFDDGMGVTKLKSYDFGRLGHAQPVNPILGGVEQTLVGEIDSLKKDWTLQNEKWATLKSRNRINQVFENKNQ